MKRLVFVFLVLSSLFSYSQSIVGKWKSIDEKTGEDESIIEIYLEDGKYYGKIIELLNPDKKGAICEKCIGKYKNNFIKGLVIVKGLTKNGEEWSGGKVLDPKNGKEYKCYITFKDKNTLKLRGYIGFSVFGRTTYWYRVNNS
mgnify:CR=1 FL=1